MLCHSLTHSLTLIEICFSQLVHAVWSVSLDVTTSHRRATEAKNTGSQRYDSDQFKHVHNTYNSGKDWPPAQHFTCGRQAAPKQKNKKQDSITTDKRPTTLLIRNANLNRKSVNLSCDFARCGPRRSNKEKNHRKHQNNSNTRSPKNLSL